MNLSGNPKYMPEGLTMLCATPLLLNRSATRRYDDLSVPCDQVLATYAWIDGSGLTMRSKDRTIDFVPKTGTCSSSRPTSNANVLLGLTMLCATPLLLNRSATRRYDDLSVPCDQVLATYAWIDGSGLTMRSKDRTIDFVPKTGTCSSSRPTSNANVLLGLTMLCATPLLLNRSATRRYDDLSVPCDQVLATYAWIDGSGLTMRSKDRTIDFVPKTGTCSSSRPTSNANVLLGLTMLCATPLLLNRSATRRYDDLSVPCDQVLATYAWIDGSGLTMRSKDRTIDFVPKTGTCSSSRPTSNANVLLGLTMLCATPLLLNRSATRRYDDLSVPCDQVLATYAWIDGSGLTMRSKDRTIDFVPKTNKDLPIWYFDGSNTQQASSENSDTFLYPQVLYRDPFRRGSHVLALCDTYAHNYEPTDTNRRKGCVALCEKAEAEEPWFGFQQELVLAGGDGRPLGWPAGGFPAPPGPYYCGLGANRVVARDLMEAFYKCCLFAGIKMFGMNPGVSPAQWYYQIGPSPGIKSADELWMSRYILTRLAEEYGVLVSFEPQPVPSWPGCGASVYFSTADMREDDGILMIEKCIDKLSLRHGEHMAEYDAHGGADNARRLGGGGSGGGACNHRDFTAGVANRNCSVRIPRQVSADRRGYLEDRRPASNADPYRVLSVMLRTCVFNE